MAFAGGGGDQFEIIGKIVVDDKGTATITGLQSRLQGIQTDADSAGSSFLNFGNIVSVALGTLAAQAVQKLGSILGDMLGSFISNASAVEVILAKLNQTLISTGDVSGMTTQDMRRLANSMRDLAGGSDDAVLSAEGVLARFTNISHDQFPQVLKLTLDLATAMGTDASTAARQLGIALQEPGYGAQRLFAAIGEQLLPAQRKAIEQMTQMGDVAGAQKLLMEALATAVGGQAAAAADTMSGKWQIMKGHAGDFAQEIGSHLLPILEHLLDVITPIMDGFYAAFENTFLPLIDQASVWGEGIINALAEGMQAAFSVVEQVIAELGSMIASLMAPGSPPKFLSNLDEWGREAMNVYLKGWTTFDKSVLDEIGAAIKAGLPQAQIQSYANAEHALADANNAVAAAQANLNAVTAQYDALLAPLNEKLKQLQSDQQDSRDQKDIAALQNVINSSFYDAAQKKQAADQIEIIQTQEKIRHIQLEKDHAVGLAQGKLKSAEDQQKAAKATETALKNQLDIQIEMANGAKQAEAAVKGLHGALASLGDLGKGGGGLGGLADKLKTDMSNLKDQIAGQTAAIQGNINAFVANVKSKINEFLSVFQPLFDSIGRLKSAFDENLPNMETMWGNTWELIKKDVQAIDPQIVSDVRGMVKDVSTALDGLVAAWSKSFGVLQFIQTVFTTVTVTAISLSITALGASLKIGMDIIEGIFTLAWQVITGNFQNFLDFLTGVFTGDWTNFTNDFEGNIDKFSSTVGRIWSGVWDTAYSTAQTDIDLIKNAIDSLWKAAQSLFDWLSSHVFNFKISLPELPKWAIPGSPTPFEMGLRGIADAMRSLNGITVNPMLGAAGGAVSNTYGGNTSNVNMTQNVYTSGANFPLSTGFSLLRSQMGI